MKIQNKILLILLCIVLVFGIGIFYIRSYERHRTELLFRDRLTDLKIRFDKILELKGATLEAYTFDYSYWDDLVEFVSTSDTHWARQNIDVTTPSFNVTAVWVLKSNLALVYATNNINDTTLRNVPLSLTTLEHLLADTLFQHFFIETRTGIMEIRTAPIQPTGDNKRLSKPFGYYIVGRLWNEDILREYEDLIRGDVRFINNKSEENTESIDDKYGTVVFIKDLRNWNGATIAQVRVQVELPIMRVLQNTVEQELYVLIFFIFSTLVAVAILLIRWVSKPLLTITKSMRTEDVSLIQHLRNENTEFGHISELINSFFQQRKLLLNEIAERKKNEEIIREAQQQYQELIDTVDGIVWEANPNTFEFIYVSKQAERILGYPVESWLHNATFWQEHIHPDERELTVEFCKTATRELRNHQMEYRMLASNGAYVWLRDIVTVIKKVNSDEVQLRGLIVDITEQKLLEENLRQTQKMESIGTLAGGIAHDFNNILGIIVGLASQLTDDMPAHRLNFISEEIKRMVLRGANLVRQILTFARKAPVHFAALNVNDEIYDFLRLLNETFPKTIEQKFEPTNILPEISADHNQLSSVLLNLSVNARDAMPNGGALTFKTFSVSKETLTERFPNALAENYVCISVRDTGTGMDEVTQRKIFEPFFTTKDIGKGTGLGLAVVYGIINSHNGFIDVQSNVTTGTEFLLYFPAINSEAKTDVIIADVPQQKPLYGSETVLIIEDEELILEFLVTLFQKYGYNVLTAADGEEGLLVFTSNSSIINIVISDYGLPKINGIDLLRLLKAHSPNVKVIISSGNISSVIQHEAEMLGVAEFMHKPYEIEEMLRQVRKVLDEH
ncbi:MAG: response regulator [Bacteroidota bacterium]